MKNKFKILIGNSKGLDLEKMLEEIDNLVCTDFCADMCAKDAFGNKFTQEEAFKMAEIIGRVYSVSHCLTCKACQTKYVRNQKRKKE